MTKLPENFDIRLRNAIHRWSWLHQGVHTVDRWSRVIRETAAALSNKNISLLSAGIAYYGVLAFFPMLFAVIAFASITLQPSGLDEATTTVSHWLPTYGAE